MSDLEQRYSEALAFYENPDTVCERTLDLQTLPEFLALSYTDYQKDTKFVFQRAQHVERAPKPESLYVSKWGGDKLFLCKASKHRRGPLWLVSLSLYNLDPQKEPDMFLYVSELVEVCVFYKIFALFFLLHNPSMQSGKT